MSASRGSNDAVSGTFLNSLGADERAALEELGVRREYPRGAMLMLEREPDERVMLLLRGRAKVGRVDRSGRELLLDIADPGDVLGELAFIDGQPRIASVIALEPVEALVLGADAFQGYLRAQPEVMLAMTEMMSRRFREAQRKRSQFSTLDTMGRLAARLLELAERYGEQTEQGIEVALPITQDELAAWAGASRAGTSQALRELRALGWITLERRRLVVRDLEALRARGE